MWTPGQFFKQTSASSKRSSPAYNWNSKVLSHLRCSAPLLAYHNTKSAILFFKAINGLAPNYISNLVNILCPSKYLLRRNNEVLLEPYNGKTKKTLGDRVFAVAAPRLFNSLPREIRHETCFNTFKTKVKTFLFRKAFC